MATTKQIEANRRNAQKSTGPKSREGKAAAAQNALKHGLYSATLLLPEEDHARYDALCDEYLDHYQPEGLEEIELVEQLVTGKWELIRLNLMKQGVFNRTRAWVKKEDAEQDGMAVRLCMEVGEGYTQEIARISQMEERIRRRSDRARRDLRQLQQQRASEAPAEAAYEPETSPAEPATARQPDPIAVLAPAATIFPASNSQLLTPNS